MEHKIAAKNASVSDKKPKDLLRAIGKIESNDWNIREIEKKIEQSKKTEVGKSREKVPKWSKEQFLQRQNKMSRPLDRQDTADEKFKDIDQTIKNLDKQLKDGKILERGERGKNKVASIAGTFGKKDEQIQQQIEEKSTIQKSVRSIAPSSVIVLYCYFFLYYRIQKLALFLVLRVFLKFATSANKKFILWKKYPLKV